MYNVLIADDDVDAWFRINSLLRRYLVKANFVTSLAAARKWVDQKVPSLLFLDKQLQDQSSLDFIRYVRTNHPGVKVVMVDKHGEGSMGFRSMADINIGKPIIPEIVERVIVKMLFPQLQSFEPA